jgi:hypothetical protein
MFFASLSACDEGSSPGSAPEFRTEHPNAPELNGASLNGSSLNGLSLNGFTINGFTINGFTINGFTINGFTINGTQFQGTLADGHDTPISGTQMIGASITLVNGFNIYVLTLDNIYKNPSAPDGDVYFYDISVYDVLQNQTTPLCTHNGQPTQAIPLRNHWDLATGDRIDDPDVITFACRGAVLAKCVEWGYEPWRTATRCDEQGQNCAEVSLADYHQACTRMARNDYCGDGTPHTVNGTPIDVYDRLSPNIQSPVSAGHPAWGVEAEWGPDGAVCFGGSSRLQMLEDLDIPYVMPPCLEDLAAEPDCGSFPAARGGLVGDSYCEAYSTAPELCK